MTMRKKSILHKRFAPGTPTVRVTQLQAAVRQLVHAIEMFFFEKDAVSIHSLARNAEEILSAILSTRGLESMWSSMIEAIKPERRDEFQGMVDGARLAFKHRVTGEHEIIEMPLEANDLFLLIGTHAIHANWPDIFKDHPEFLLFEMWYMVHHPDALVDTSLGAATLKEFPLLKGQTKPEFYRNGYESVRVALK